MGESAVELTQSQLQQIADYVKSQIPDWVYRSDPPNRELTERMLAIEQELKAQRELMAARFQAVDQRFEDMNQRFEDMNQRFADTQRYMEKRFDTLQWMWAGGFLLVTLLMSIYQFLG